MFKGAHNREGIIFSCCTCLLQSLTVIQRKEYPWKQQANKIHISHSIRCRWHLILQGFAATELLYYYGTAETYSTSELSSLLYLWAIESNFPKGNNFQSLQGMLGSQISKTRGTAFSVWSEHCLHNKLQNMGRPGIFSILHWCSVYMYSNDTLWRLQLVMYKAK